MIVLVAAASKHGATGEIADRIGADLAKRGLEVEVKRLADVKALDQYDAFVLGSAIYLGTWLRKARRFIEAHGPALSQRPT